MTQVLFDIVISIITFSDNVNLNGIEKLNEESLLSPYTWTIRT